jgi:hypothetical protein
MMFLFLASYSFNFDCFGVFLLETHSLFCMDSSHSTVQNHSLFFFSFLFFLVFLFSCLSPSVVWTFLKLSVPSGLAVTLEIAGFEAVSFLAASFGVLASGVHVTAFQILVLAFFFSSAFLLLTVQFFFNFFFVFQFLGRRTR